MFYCPYKEWSIELFFYCSKTLTHTNYRKTVKKRAEECFTCQKAGDPMKKADRNRFYLSKSHHWWQKTGFTRRKTRVAGKTVDRNRLYTTKNWHCQEDGRQNTVLHYKKLPQAGKRQIEPGFTCQKTRAAGKRQIEPGFTLQKTSATGFSADRTRFYTMQPGFRQIEL